MSSATTGWRKHILTTRYRNYQNKATAPSGCWKIILRPKQSQLPGVFQPFYEQRESPAGRGNTGRIMLHVPAPCDSLHRASGTPQSCVDFPKPRSGCPQRVNNKAVRQVVGGPNWIFTNFFSPLDVPTKAHGLVRRVTINTKFFVSSRKVRLFR